MKGLFIKKQYGYKKYDLFSVQHFPGDKISYICCRGNQFCANKKQLIKIRDAIDKAIDEMSKDA